MSPPRVDTLRGLWQRSLIEWPDGRRDTTTSVRWLQGVSFYLDLRRPAGAPDFVHAEGLADLTAEDCAWLATQEGFAGVFSFDDGWFEWARAIDFQPQARHPDAGTLRWQDGILVEEGRNIAYIEHWHRDAEADPPVAALALRDVADGRKGFLLRAGPHFMLARDRAVVPTSHGTLAECVAAASSLEAARALVDCEISFGTVGPDGFRIIDSSLPYRVDDEVVPRLSGDLLVTADRDARGGRIARRWAVIAREGFGFPDGDCNAD